MLQTPEGALPCDWCIEACKACNYEATEAGPVYDDHLCFDCPHTSQVTG